MTDLDVAVLMIKSAQRVDKCASAEDVLNAAIEMRPELPWELAAEGLFQQYGQPFEFALACTTDIRSADNEAA